MHHKVSVLSTERYPVPAPPGVFLPAVESAAVSAVALTWCGLCVWVQIGWRFGVASRGVRDSSEHGGSVGVGDADGRRPARRTVIGVIHLPLCAPRVPCVSRVSRLPPVSFYQDINGGHARAHNHKGTRITQT